MPTTSRSLFSCDCRVVLGTFAVALLLRWLLGSALGSELSILFFWPVVLFCAWFGGLGSGLLATCLSAIAAACFLWESPDLLASARPAHLNDLAAFLLLGGILGFLTENLHRTRRQAEERGEWFEAALSSIGDGIIGTDANGRVVFVNTVAESLTGWLQSTAVGRPLEEVFRVVSEQTRKPIEIPVEKVLATGNVIVLAEHTLLIARDGRETSITDSAAAIRDQAGRILGVVLVFRDTSLERRAEHDLTETDRHKDQFLAVLGHELRNCLAPARNALLVIRQRGEERRSIMRQSWDLLDRQVKQMTRLVDDLLDLGRIGQGKLNLRQEPVELASIVERAVEMSRPFIEARKHTFTVSLPTRPVWLQADPARLIQVLTNLLNNAARYTDEGGRITLTAEEAGQEVVVRVRDNGMGIAPEMLPRLFHLFAQSARAVDRSREGLGVGLALVRNLVEMHGGTISAFSEGPGWGSEFVVRLPVREVPPPLPAAKPGKDQEKLAGRRIMVVDDNEDACESLAMLLRLLGHEVALARDGPAALETALAFEPEVVLLDIGLPCMDGYEVACRLRGQPGVGKALLIALTGYGQEQDRSRSQEAGFDHHLVKPVDLDTLHQLFASASAEI